MHTHARNGQGKGVCVFNKLKNNFKKRNLKSIINLFHSGSKGVWLRSQSIIFAARKSSGQTLFFISYEKALGVDFFSQTV